MRQSLSKGARLLVVDDNPAILRLLSALFADEGVGVTLAANVPEAKAALLAANWDFDLILSDISMPGETGFDLLEWVKRPDSPGRQLPVLLTTAHLPEANNRVKGLAMGAVDYVVRPVEMSELVIRTLNAVGHFRRTRALEASLQDSADLAMVGRLLAASHHEIKNLANLVCMASTQAIKCFEKPGRDAGPAGVAALRALGQSSDLLFDVARSVSSLLSPAATNCSALDLKILVQECVELMIPRVRPLHVSLSVPALDGGHRVMGHPVRIKQILINLILNAADAITELSPGDGGHIEVILSGDATHCRLLVRDNGIGLSEAGVRREFKPFSTTKTLRGGQGLGLWLCATMAQNMGGVLTLSSQGAGLGADAALDLPRTQGAGDEASLDLSSYFVDE